MNKAIQARRFVPYILRFAEKLLMAMGALWVLYLLVAVAAR